MLDLIHTKQERVMKYRNLVLGEKLQVGDEAYTWADLDCTRLGWIEIDKNNVGEIYNPAYMVPVRRPIKKS